VSVVEQIYNSEKKARNEVQSLPLSIIVQMVFSTLFTALNSLKSFCFLSSFFTYRHEYKKYILL
jgi:hypothetical protein